MIAWRVLLMFLLCVGVYKDAFACTCPSFTKKQVKKLIKQAEYVVVGEAIKNVHFQERRAQEYDSLGGAIEALVRIDRLMKSDTAMSFVYVNQFEVYNCHHVFRFNETYVILGRRVLYFSDNRADRTEEFGKIPATEQAPPHTILGSYKAVRCYSHSSEEITFWNQIASESIVLYTDQCFVFPIDDPRVKKILPRTGIKLNK